MVAIVLTSDATKAMRTAFYYFGTSGQMAVGHPYFNDMVAKARRDIRVVLPADGKVQLELHRMILITSIQRYLVVTSDKARIKTRMTAIRDALIAELDTTVDTLYTPGYVLPTA